MNIKELNINDLVDKKYFHKKINNLYLSDYQISVLNMYKIEYEKCRDNRELLFIINSVIDEYDECEDLEDIEREISEYMYYHYTNK